MRNEMMYRFVLKLYIFFVNNIFIIYIYIVWKIYNSSDLAVRHVEEVNQEHRKLRIECIDPKHGVEINLNIEKEFSLYDKQIKHYLYCDYGKYRSQTRWFLFISIVFVHHDVCKKENKKEKQKGNNNKNKNNLQAKHPNEKIKEEIISEVWNPLDVQTK